jgi:geranylgeranyl diphosphate synthase, type II
MTETAGITLEAYLAKRRHQIDEALDSFFPSPPACPAIVAEAMRYSVTAGGKRLRPILALAAAEAVAAGSGCREAAPVEGRIALALPSACAIELIHTYSLIHDDLPAMDNDVLRRGLPTAHVVYGEGIAILAGDGLLTEAFDLMAREPASEDDTGLALRKLRVIRLVARAAGPAGMVGGQAIDLQATASAGARSPGGFDLVSLRDMHAKKTGAIIRAAAVSGAVMAGGTEEQIQAVDTYAAELGLAFQIVDDILDIEGATEDIGKTAGKDKAAGKPTYPALLGLDESRRLAADCIGNAVETLNSVGLTDNRLGEIARWTLRRGN